MQIRTGKDLLLKLDQTGSGNFLTVAGLRSRVLSLNAAIVDFTDAESTERWRKMLADGELRRAAVSGAGVFKDKASDAKLRELFFAGSIRDWQLVLPDFGIVQGPFQITALQFSADNAGEVTFDMALESGGPLKFLDAGAAPGIGRFPSRHAMATPDAHRTALANGMTSTRYLSVKR